MQNYRAYYRGVEVEPCPFCRCVFIKWSRPTETEPAKIWCSGCKTDIATPEGSALHNSTVAAQVRRWNQLALEYREKQEVVGG